MTVIVQSNLLCALPPLDYSAAILLSDREVFDRYGPRVIAQLPFKCEVFLVPQGEAGKELAVARACWEKMEGLDHQSVVITLGGGAICDLGGFVASTFMRGIGLIHIPTTLLAMVDAAIGGKNGLNLGGKNRIGTVYEAKGVMVDPEVLKTLPEEEIRAGMAEVVKIGMVADPHLLEMEEMVSIIERSIRLKERIVREGRRTLLNWGHTFAHALEALMGYRIRHGEAVAIGMGWAARLSVAMGLAGPELIEVQEGALRRRGISVALPKVDGERMVELMARDKKGRGGKVACVVSRGVGMMELNPEVDKKLIREILAL
ncbi:MAG: 3-dehydroquinate synthase family protein [Parachlamydiales bacterium]